MVRRALAVLCGAVFVMPVLTCGGTVSNAPCEGAFGPLTSPLDVPFLVSYGTAMTDDRCGSQLCNAPITHLFILFTPDASGCPAGWISGDVPGDGSGITKRDIHVLWLAVSAPASDQFVGTYHVASSPWSSGCTFLDCSPYIVSALLPKGTDIINGFDGMGANGTITITKFIHGKEVAGSFDATFTDGTHRASEFDVPVCTDACAE